MFPSNKNIVSLILSHFPCCGRAFKRWLVSLFWLYGSSIQIWDAEVDLAFRAGLKETDNMEKYGSFNLRQRNCLLS
jgi:hypothetical protein